MGKDGMLMSFGDRLANAVRDKHAPVCVGLDPLVERLPESLRSLNSATDAITAFGRGVIEAVAPLVPAIKINIAFFEPYGPGGITAYHELIAVSHCAGLLVIGDVKRADIGHTSAQYAKATLGGAADDPAVADAVTVNPYFGWDGVGPFVETAQATGRGLFVLVQTSNESASRVQGLTLADGSMVCHSVAQMVQEWAGADGLVGLSGYSCIGAVVSPRDLPSTVRLRDIMPNCIFLVPGFGAQGRTADEVAKCFKPDGTGAVVAASRSVIFAHNEPKYRSSSADWKSCVAAACRDFVTTIRTICNFD